MGEKQLSSMSDKLLEHLAAHASDVFQPTVRLFPPGFPKTEEESFIDSDLEQLSTLVEDLTERIQSTQKKLDHLKNTDGAQVYLDNLE